MSKMDELPRWFEGGEEICPFCGQTYIYEMERRCTLCDSAVCPCCCPAEDTDLLCPDCVPCGKEERSL